MSKPPPMLGQSEYERLVGQSQRTVFWALDGASGPWELDAGEAPAAAADWFFVVNFPRTGSTVAAEILNRHPDIYCANEHNVLPLLMTLLHSRLLFAPELFFSVRYSQRIAVTPANVRTLMDAWRRCVSRKPIFGDKGEMYHQYFGAACSGIFPGCKFVLTVRHPLDTLSSYIRQPWATYMRDGGNRERFLDNVRQRAREMLAGNAAWRKRAEVIEFEQLVSEAAFRRTFSRVFTHLGADPACYDWEGGWALCQHRSAVGRWERDAEMSEFMDWLETRDSQLHRLLASGAFYLDSN